MSLRATTFLGGISKGRPGSSSSTFSATFGSMIAAPCTTSDARSTSSLSNHRASTSSVLSMLCNKPSSSYVTLVWSGSAVAEKATMQDRGNGQGWLATYSMLSLSTTTPVSSRTSLATAFSKDSPASTKPASTVCILGGCRWLRASNNLEPQRLETETMMEGSCRGQDSANVLLEAQFEHSWAVPPCVSFNGDPQVLQCLLERCQLA
mmetsp:Transcript_2848/g.6135  ORF Transcript_2848/g.6135 Transcript_2848/m.6135 type:complete len:207 (+) Transcript_2848:425-1045(+)